MIYLTPKTMPCKECGKKPKQQVWAMGYGESDDQAYLVHWCTPKNKKVYFPEPKNSPFTAYVLKSQIRMVLESWNSQQGVPQ